MNWWGIQGGGVICFSRENVSSLSLLYLFILFFICRSVGQRLRTGKINLFCRVIFSDELDSYCCKNLLVV